MKTKTTTMISAFLNIMIVTISLTTAVSVLVHDMHIDKVATTVAAPISNNDNSKIATGISPDLHTHPERHSLSRLLGQRTPATNPRFEEKKHLLQKHATKGHHPFDNYYLPQI